MFGVDAHLLRLVRRVYVEGGSEEPSRWQLEMLFGAVGHCLQLHSRCTQGFVFPD